MCIYTASYQCGHTVHEPLPCYQYSNRSRWGSHVCIRVRDPSSLLTRCPHCLFPRDRKRYDKAKILYPIQARGESQEERLKRLNIPNMETIPEDPQPKWEEVPESMVETSQKVLLRALSPSHSFKVMRGNPRGVRYKLRSKFVVVREWVYELRYRVS